MEAVGLSNPQLEHLDVLKITFDTARATNPELTANSRSTLVTKRQA